MVLELSARRNGMGAPGTPDFQFVPGDSEDERR